MITACIYIHCRTSGADNWSPGKAWMGSSFRIVPLHSCPFIHVPLCLSGTGLCYDKKKKAALPGDADGQLPAPIRRQIAPCFLDTQTAGCWRPCAQCLHPTQHRLSTCKASHGRFAHIDSHAPNSPRSKSSQPCMPRPFPFTQKNFGKYVMYEK